MQPQGRFCTAGAPVVDGRSVLIAIGGEPAAADGDFLTRLIDAVAVRAAVQEYRGP